LTATLKVEKDYKYVFTGIHVNGPKEAWWKWSAWQRTERFWKVLVHNVAYARLPATTSFHVRATVYGGSATATVCLLHPLFSDFRGSPWISVVTAVPDSNPTFAQIRRVQNFPSEWRTARSPWTTKLIQWDILLPNCAI